jgi:transglutaminase-like putative cysteine protease
VKFPLRQLALFRIGPGQFRGFWARALRSIFGSTPVSSRVPHVKEFLEPQVFVDSSHPSIAHFAREAVAGIEGEKPRAIALYYAVRDTVSYDPYLDYSNPEVFRASSVLEVGRGFCGGKAALLAAAARAVGIPARPGYADVRNHMTSKKLAALVETDIFYWHSYAELFLDRRWVKCTPAFDRALCERAKIAPLEFDGMNDSLFHPFDPAGRKHMEYLQDRGAYADVPFETILAEFRQLYPRLVASGAVAGDFKAEVETSA